MVCCTSLVDFMLLSSVVQSANIPSMQMWHTCNGAVSSAALIKLVSILIADNSLRIMQLTM